MCVEIFTLHSEIPFQGEFMMLHESQRNSGKSRFFRFSEHQKKYFQQYFHELISGTINSTANKQMSEFFSAPQFKKSSLNITKKKWKFIQIFFCFPLECISRENVSQIYFALFSQSLQSTTSTDDDHLAHTFNQYQFIFLLRFVFIFVIIFLSRGKRKISHSFSRLMKENFLPFPWRNLRRICEQLADDALGSSWKYLCGEVWKIFRKNISNFARDNLDAKS